MVNSLSISKSGLQHLGEEKFTKIKNELIRGKACMALAREIQGTWGDMIGVPEKTLTQQLQRLKNSLVRNGNLGEAQKQILEETGKISIKLLRESRLDVLSRLVSMANVYEHRIQLLWDREVEMKMPLTGLNIVMKDYTDLLERIQKIQFDLGIDLYKGILVQTRSATHTITNPDGSKEERSVMEATQKVEDIFRMRGIYGRDEDGNRLEG